MKPISFAVGINDWAKEISGLGDLSLQGIFKNGLHVNCKTEDISNVTMCKMVNSHVECFEDCGKSKYRCDCTVRR